MSPSDASSPQPLDYDLAIVGAGIGGLALAVAMSRQGMRVAVIEARNNPPRPSLDGTIEDWDRRVSALTPASAEFLESLGVWPGIEAARSGPYRTMSVWDAQGTGEITFTAREAAVPVLGHIVENRVTIDALIAVAERSRNLDIYWGEGLQAIDHQAQSAVTVITNAGRMIRAPLLAGADGARSRVRTEVGFETRDWSYDQHAIVATIALTGPHNGTCFQSFLPSGPLALLPLADPQLCSIVWSVDNPEVDKLIDLETADFIAALNRALASKTAEVNDASERAAFPLTQCHAVDYVSGRVVLVADAAHSIHPLAGQGINLGLSDVRVLAAELADAFLADLDWGSPGVLSRYQRQRKGENLAMMAAMEGFKRGFGSTSPLVRVARNTGLKWVNETGWVKRWFASQALT